MESLLRDIFLTLSNFFLIYLIGNSLNLSFLTIKGIKKSKRARKQQEYHNRLNHDYYIPVSIIVSTEDDEKKIETCLKALQNLNYKLYEIVIVDNGSIDRTTEIIITKYELKKVNRPIHRVLPTGELTGIYQNSNQKIKITLITKSKTKKKDALNAGINVAEYPYVIFITPNFVLKKETLENLVRPILEDDKVIICNGTLQIGSEQSKTQEYTFPTSFLSKLQVFEWNRKNNIEQVYRYLPSLTLFKKDMIQVVKGFNEEAIGENFELMHKIKNKITEKENNKIKESNNAVALYNPTSNIIEFMKQRYKQYHGLKKSLKKEYQGSRNLINKIKILDYWFYGKYSSWITLLGTISLIMSCMNKTIELQNIIIFFTIYILFCSTLSFCLFLINLWEKQQKISFFNFLKSMFWAVCDNTLLPILLFFIKIP